MLPEEKVTDSNSKFLAVTAGFLKVGHLLPQHDSFLEIFEPQHNGAIYSKKFSLFTSVIKDR
jgi:hypothetical protein